MSNLEFLMLVAGCIAFACLCLFGVWWAIGKMEPELEEYVPAEVVRERARGRHRKE